MVALPFVPSDIFRRLAAAARYYDEHSQCVFCRIVKEEATERERVVYAGKYVSVLTRTNYAARSRQRRCAESSTF